ncbi:redoxin domain-containing protein [Colwellia sp. M166]|jgi:peroxiredoxin|nr:redoxin domain-containing protein [Colwellia sp. M166]|tara:strand:- start:1006 stop:1551 length:546 start_codon:yes stop_codon:yes gene_type:complete
MYIAHDMKIKNIILPAIDGTIFDMHSIAGKPFMLSFFRFASCPFCNMRMHELVKRYGELGDDFTIVALFDSPIDNLTLHAEGHNAPFPILADEDNWYYKQYGIKHSVLGVIKGMLFRMPTLIQGMAKGYIPTTIKGSMTTMPADFLVTSNGMVHQAYYGKDEGDHLPFDRIKEFSHQQSFE